MKDQASWRTVWPAPQAVLAALALTVTVTRAGRDDRPRGEAGPSTSTTRDSFSTGTQPSVGADVSGRHWAFQKPVRCVPPRVEHWDRIRTAIDSFVLAQLEANGLSFSPDANPTSIVRRTYL